MWQPRGPDRRGPATRGTRLYNPPRRREINQPNDGDDAYRRDRHNDIEAFDSRDQRSQRDQSNQGFGPCDQDDRRDYGGQGFGPRDQISRDQGNRNFKKPDKLQSNEVMNFDPDTNDIITFIGHISLIEKLYSAPALLKVLPLCLKG